MRSVIVGSGSFVPPNVIKNSAFIGHSFYDDKKRPLTQPSEEIVGKFKAITGIEERRYADDTMTASGMAALAGGAAISDAGIDPETIDLLIVAHNFGDMAFQSEQTSMVPSLASRVKHSLQIKNPSCVAYDLLFGCPGWLLGLIHADALCKAGMAKTCLVIGTETLSRVVDAYDRDSMIFADGAGAVVTQLHQDKGDNGILQSVSASYGMEDVDYINMGGANFQPDGDNRMYLKMQGRKVYEFALKHVPSAIKDCLDKNEIHITQVKKIFIHQANEKMDEAIIHRLFELYGIKEVPVDVLPMNIQMLGNSSVATIPTLFDMVRKGQIAGHGINRNDLIVFASIGAGMNINALCYKV